MSVNYIENNLSKDEQILLSIKTSPWFVWPWIISWGILALTCFRADIIIGGYVLSFITFIVYLHFKAIQMVVTNKRIILHEGIIATDTSEIRLEKCESVNLSKGIFGVIFNYGDIIFTGTGSAVLIWKHINAPKDTRKKIEDIFETYEKK